VISYCSPPNQITADLDGWVYYFSIVRLHLSLLCFLHHNFYCIFSSIFLTFYTMVCWVFILLLNYAVSFYCILCTPSFLLFFLLFISTTSRKREQKKKNSNNFFSINGNSNN
jgi:hypothetical protein